MYWEMPGLGRQREQSGHAAHTRRLEVTNATRPSLESLKFTLAPSLKFFVASRLSPIKHNPPTILPKIFVFITKSKLAYGMGVEMVMEELVKILLSYGNTPY